MANGGGGSVPRQGHILGFPQGIVISGKVDSKFLCALCERVLRTPMQSYCGHRFCRECIQALLCDKESEICPSCRKEESENEYSVLKLDQIFPDNAIKRDFTSVKVKCLNSGCPWTGNLKIYEEHEKSCEFLRVECERCRELIPVPKKSVHDSKECPQRPVVCTHCKYKCPAIELQDHLEVECPEQPFDCPYCTVKAIPRRKLLGHYEKECSSKMAMCPVVRCGHVGAEDGRAQHQADNALGHIDGINHKLIRLEEQVTRVLSQIDERDQLGREDGAALADFSRRIEGLERQLQTVSVTREAPRPEQPQETGGATGGATGGSGGDEDRPGMRNVDQRIAQQNQKIATFDAIAAVLNSEILKCVNRMDECMNRINTSNTQTAELVQRINVLEESNREKDELLTRIQRDMSVNTETSYDGTFVWKVTEVGRRKQEATTGRNTSIYSPGFFTSRNGYRMCLRMYLNGDGMGRGSHLSLYFVLMKGHYDPLLKWPFRQKVTLMLLDQNRRENVIDAFRPDPSSSSFKQPTSEMNIASGCPLFTPLATLDAAGNKAYIKDDIMYVKCVVDTSDLVL